MYPNDLIAAADATSQNELRHKRAQLLNTFQEISAISAADMTAEQKTRQEEAMRGIHGIDVSLRERQLNLDAAVQRALGGGPLGDQFALRHPEAARASLLNIVQGFMNGTPLKGLDAEVMATENAPMNHIPLGLLFGDGPTHAGARDFTMTATGAEATHISPKGFGGQVRERTLAGYLGLVPERVGAGVAAYPILTGVASADTAKGAAAAESPIDVTVTDISPERHVSYLNFNGEDAHRLGQAYEMKLRSEMRQAVMSGLDKQVLAAIRTKMGLTETTLAQSAKVAPTSTIEALSSMVDGSHAWSPEEVKLVISQGTFGLWQGTDSQSTGDYQSLDSVVRAAGYTYRVGGFEAATTNGKFMGYATMAQQLREAYAWPVWESAKLIADTFSKAEEGVTRLILTTYYGFKILRDANFRRFKYVT